MKPQTVTELRWHLARTKGALAQALDDRSNAENNRLQAILDQEKAERELEAHATRETESNLGIAKQKLKQATKAYETADKAAMIIYKQKIHLEDELKNMQKTKGD
ncbi:hypothetical protein CJ214_00560 [Peptoniphilus lacrimalis]|nr:hypothetical protein CJ214_00560 [Peptoniphilus lacrimalis]